MTDCCCYGRGSRATLRGRIWCVPFRSNPGAHCSRPLSSCRRPISWIRPLSSRTVCQCWTSASRGPTPTIRSATCSATSCSCCWSCSGCWRRSCCWDRCPNPRCRCRWRSSMIVHCAAYRGTPRYDYVRLVRDCVCLRDGTEITPGLERMFPLNITLSWMISYSFLCNTGKVRQEPHHYK